MDSTVVGSIIGLATALAALITAWRWVGLRRPYKTSVLVKSAESIVISSDNLLKRIEAENENLRNRMEAQEIKTAEHERKVDEYERLQRIAKVEIDELHRELANMHDELREAIVSRDEAREEAKAEREDRLQLAARVQLLEETLASYDIPVPETPPGGATP